MRILGLLFIMVGVAMCFTFFLLTPGLGCVGVGALLEIASKDRPVGSVGKVVQGVLVIMIFVTGLGGVACWIGANRAIQARGEQVVRANAAQQQPQHSPKKHATKQGSQGR